MDTDLFGCPSTYTQVLLRDESGKPLTDTELGRPVLYGCLPPAELREGAGLSWTMSASTPVGEVFIDGKPSEYIPQAVTGFVFLVGLYLSIKVINRLFYIPLNKR